MIRGEVMKKVVLSLILFLSGFMSLGVYAKEISFDCETIWFGSSMAQVIGGYVTEYSPSEFIELAKRLDSEKKDKPPTVSKLDFDLEQLTGTRENSKGSISNFYRVELLPKSLRAWELASYDNGVPRRSVHIDRETMSAIINGGIGGCTVVERKLNRKF